MSAKTKLTAAALTVLLEALREGVSVTAASSLINMSRSGVYRASLRIPELAEALKNRGEPAPDDLDPSEPDFPEEPDVHNRLSAEQVSTLCAALRKTRSLGVAARAAKVRLGQARLEVENMTREQRTAAIAFLKLIPDPSAPAPKPPEQVALRAWLANNEWPETDLDVDVLRKLSERAADSFAAHCLHRAAAQAADE